MSAMNSDRPGLSQELDEALDAVLPILNDMKKSLRATPVASRAALDQLFSLPDSFIKKDPASAAAAVIAPVPAAAPSSAPASGKPSTGDDGRLAKLAELKTKILACTNCTHLVTSRTQVVYGVGNPFSELLFVGEAPGEEEDLRGEPFVGKAGQLLGHSPYGFGEFGQLIAAGDGDADVEAAFGNLRGSGLHGVDGARQPPQERDPAERGYQRGEREPGGPGTPVEEEGSGQQSI
jgi:hypothetical protein